MAIQISGSTVIHDSQDVQVSGMFTANSFVGDASQLTNLPASGGTLEATASGTLADGSTVIVNTDGTVSVVELSGSLSPNVGSSTQFIATPCDFMGTAFVPSTNQIVLVYRNGNYYGESVVGTISGSSITFGTPTVFMSDSRFKGRGVIYHTNTDNVILHWGLKSGNSQWDGDDRLLSAKISGNSLIWSTSLPQGIYGYEFYGNYSRVGDMDFDPTTGLFQTITRRDQGYSQAEHHVRQFKISADGNSIGVHGQSDIATLTAGGHISSTPKIVTDGANSRLFAIYTNNSFQGAVKVGTIVSPDNPFGSYDISFNGSEVIFESGSTNTNGLNSYQREDFSAVYDPHHNRLVIMYKDLGDSNKTKIIVGTPSATSVSFGSAQDFSPTNVDSFDMVFDSKINKIIISYRDLTDNSKGKIVKAEVSNTGNSITVESSRLGIDSTYALAELNKLAYNTNSHKTIVTYYNSSYSVSRSVVYSPTSQTSNLTAENFIGISDGVYTNGQTATIQVTGSVDDAQVGLTTGKSYYVQEDGTLSTTADFPSVFAGTSVDSTKLIVKG